MSEDQVTLTIDGTEITVPAGTLVIRAAEMIGVDIPRFCDHPLLDPVGACRQCLVEVEGMRKPMASCTITVSEGMVVRTQHSSEDAAKAQSGVMELLLINHPLDCPTCDKGGECPLQNQAMSAGRAESRFAGVKRTYTKPVPLSSEVLLDRERCVLCARCTRFAEQVAGDPLIALSDRGAMQQVSAYREPGTDPAGPDAAADAPFDSYFSGNTVQICPVGALTGTAYRFRARPFDLVSSPSVCEHCASGCAQRTDHRRGKVLRRLAGDDPDVNEEWNCDKGRWAFAYTRERDRITSPLLRGEDGVLHPTSWTNALHTAAQGLAASGRRTGVLLGGRCTVEDAYAYGKFARAVLGTPDVDFRARAHSGEEAQFLAAHVAGSGIGLTYRGLESAATVVLAGFEPEEESPVAFLRLRKAVRAGLRVHTIASWLSPGAEKLSATLHPCVPGQEARALAEMSDLLAAPGTVLVVGERLAASPGALSAATAAGVPTAWIPRRAGERGALDVGAAPGLLPAGRPVRSERARADIERVWGTSIPSETGRSTSQILDALIGGDLDGLVIGGVELDDLPDPAHAARALQAASFVVSLEQRASAATRHADVVFPVAAAPEKSGTYLDWEGRPRPFPAALPVEVGSVPLSDHRVLHALAAEIGDDLGCDSPQQIHGEFERIGSWGGERHVITPTAPVDAPAPAPGTAVLASWRMLLDLGRMQDGEPHLAGTARTPVARLSATTAEAVGVADGETLAISTAHGTITLPLSVTDMPDGVVWAPMNSPDSQVCRTLRAVPGDVVEIGAPR